MADEHTPPDGHRCPRCGSRRWIGYGMWPNSGPVKAQCVPCGKVYDHPNHQETTR